MSENGGAVSLGRLRQTAAAFDAPLLRPIGVELRSIGSVKPSEWTHTFASVRDSQYLRLRRKNPNGQFEMRRTDDDSRRPPVSRTSKTRRAL